MLCASPRTSYHMAGTYLSLTLIYPPPSDVLPLAGGGTEGPSQGDDGRGRDRHTQTAHRLPQAGHQVRRKSVQIPFVVCLRVEARSSPHGAACLHPSAPSLPSVPPYLPTFSSDHQSHHIALVEPDCLTRTDYFGCKQNHIDTLDQDQLQHLQYVLEEKDLNLVFVVVCPSPACLYPNLWFAPHCSAEECKQVCWAIREFTRLFR